MSFAKNVDVQIVLLLLLLSCIFFWKIFIYPEKIIFAEYFSDVISYFDPLRFFISETWKNYAKLPLWNPYIFMGHPFVGNPLSSMFYPQNFLYLFLSVDQLFGFLFLINIFLIGTFTYLFTRVLGIDRFGSFVSAIIFMFSGITIIRVYGGHPGNLDIISLMPLAFLLLELAIKKGSYFYSMLTGIPLGLSFLAGNIQVAIYSSFALFLYFSLRAVFILKKKWDLKRLIKLISLIFLSFIIALLLSSIQILPSAELLSYSSRHERASYTFAASYSLPPEQLAMFLVPELFGTFLDGTYWGSRNFWELSVYMGVLPLVLVAVALAAKKSDYKLIFISLSIFSILFALGRYFILYPLFYHFVPFFDIFRKPVVILFLTVFSLSVLSGFGSSLLMRKMNKRDEKMLWLLIKLLSLVIILVLGTILSIWVKREDIILLAQKMLGEKYHAFVTYVHPLPYDISYYMGKIPMAYSHILNGLSIFLIMLIFTAFILILRLKEKISIRGFQVIMILLILSDLWLFGMKYIDVEGPEKIFSERIPVGLLKTNDDKFRVLDCTDSFPYHISMRQRIETLGGYDPIQLKSYRDFILYFFDYEHPWEIEPFIPICTNKTTDLKAVNSKILALLNVRYVMLNFESPSEEFNLKFNITTPVYDMYMPTGDTKKVYIYENKNFLPRALVVRNAKVIKDKQATLNEMDDERFNPREYVLLEDDVDVPLNNSGSFEVVNVTFYSSNEIHIEADMENPGFLVLSENWYPGWKAYDNGKEVKIYKANYILRSIYLDEGKHSVKFIYDPLSYKIGTGITIGTLAFLIVLIFYCCKKKVIF